MTRPMTPRALAYRDTTYDIRYVQRNQRIVERCEWEDFDDRLHHGGEALVRKEDARENPHRHHDEINDAAGALNFLCTACTQQPECRKRQSTQRADEHNRCP